LSGFVTSVWLQTWSLSTPHGIFERFPKDRYQTEIESWRHLQSDNIEFTLKRLREPIDADNHRELKVKGK
jgi:hypothetical protein